MWRGYPMEPEQQFIEKVVGLHRQGWQLAIHGNGDDAIQMILNAYEEAQKRYPAPTPGTLSSTARPCARSARPHQAAWRGALVLRGPHLFLGRPPLKCSSARTAPGVSPSWRPGSAVSVQQPQRHVRDSHRSSAFRLVRRQQAHQRRTHLGETRPSRSWMRCAA